MWLQIFGASFKGEQMIRKTVSIKTEYIKLSDLLKYASIVSSGSEAKYLVTEGHVLVDGEVDLRRGRKVYPGMTVSGEFDGDEFLILVSK